MVCDVNTDRIASGTYPGNPVATVLRTRKGRQYSGRMQCSGRPGVDRCTDAVCPLPAMPGIGWELDCNDLNPPTGFP